MQLFRAANHQLVTGRQAGQNFDIAAALRAQAHGPALQLLVADKIHDLLSAVAVHCRLGNDRTGLDARVLSRRRSGAQERYLYAHVGQNRVVKLVKGDAHFHGSFLPVCRGNYRPHFGRKLAVRIRIQRRAHALPRLHPRDVGFVDVHFNLKGIHVDQRSDASAGESAAGRDGRDDFTTLRIF